VLPLSGNPHNQLAVMAVMTGDELRAVYHYARSLCVGIPFWTARENLLLLFEQNRARWVLLR
jgi:protein SMG7